MTDEEVIKERCDLEMMRRPHLWPNDYLFLKKPAGKLKHYQFALLANDEKDRWAIIPLRDDGNGRDLASERSGADELLVQLVKEGWLVD